MVSNWKWHFNRARFPASLAVNGKAMPAIAQPTETDMKYILALGAALGPLLLTPDAEAAQCGPRDMVTASLNRQFHESRQAIGLSGQAVLIELYVSTSGSWTMTGTNPHGITCVIAAGEAWQAEKPKVIGLNS
jgi:hypothetical protein